MLLLLVHRTVLRFAYIHHVRTRHVARIAVLVVRVLSRPGFHDSVTLVPAVAPLLLFGLSVVITILFAVIPRRRHAS